MEVKKRPEFDPRRVGAYTPAQSARWFRVPPATVHVWATGQHYQRGGSKRFSRPVIQPTGRARRGGPPIFSFVNLVELHVLSALRRVHEVPLPRIRAALEYLAEHYPEVEHPLADLDLLTEGRDVWLDELGTHLVAVSRHGQLGIRDVVAAHLRRIDRGKDGKAIRLYPFVRRDLTLDQPRAIELDPLLAFGRPTIAGSGIPTSIIAGRFEAGESLDSLARDYGRSREELEEAIRWESRAAA